MAKVITFSQKGDFSKTLGFFERVKNFAKMGFLDKYGQKGVDALREATPEDTGNTANSWYYEINRDQNGCIIEWKNSNINKGISIALILQYGHGTRNGGYFVGIDYVNPAIKPIFNEIAKEAWYEVTR